MRKFLSSNLAIFIFSVAIILLLIFLNYAAFLQKPKDFIYQFTTPIQRSFYKLTDTTTNYLSAIFLSGKILSQNQWLEGQNIKLNIELSKLKEIEKENIALREHMGFAEKEKFKFILANVVGQDPSNLSQYLIIDKGIRNNVEVDYPVTSASGLLIGRVAEIFDSSAKVQLLTDPLSAVNVLTQTSRTTGILKGEAGELIIEMIPQNSQIEVGENVLTSGLGSIFPKGLLIGKVEEIIISDIEIFKKARVKPLFNIRETEIVFIMVK